MRPEPLIIGAGPAGCAAAIRLGQVGHRPLLLERATGPADKVCGDFLGADAIARLRSLGVDPAGLGAAPIHRLRLMHGGRMVETSLPFVAMGLSRRVLDDALLRRAAETGAEPRPGTTVRRIGPTATGWRIDIGGGQEIDAADVFLATGKHDLRDLPRPGTRHGAIGMKMYYDLASRQTAAVADAIELILFPGGYAGLQIVETGKAVLCIALRRDAFQRSGGTWAGLLRAIQSATPLLGERLRGAEPLLPRPLSVAGVPYGFLDRERHEKEPDLFRLGDQMAVIPSLTGDGIAIALHSGTVAAQSWHDGLDARAYQRRLVHDLVGQMRLARWLHKLAMTGPLQAAALRGAAVFPPLLRRAAVGTRVSGQVTTIPGQETRGLHPA